MIAIEQQPISEKDAAALLGVKPTTLRQWRARGEGPAFLKVGRRRILYEPEALRRYLGKARREPGSVQPSAKARVA